MKESILSLRADGKTYNQIRDILGCSKSTISFHCGDGQKEKSQKRLQTVRFRKKHNIPVPKKLQKESISKKIEIIHEETKSCIVCGKLYENTINRRRGRHCSLSCAGITTNKDKREKFLKEWKLGTISGGKREGYGVVSVYVRTYIFEKYSSKCAKCGWDKINPYTNTLPLEIDHIDGNSENHREENLILLCPNCHSLEPTNSTNKGGGRRYFRDLYRNKKNIVVRDGVKPPESEDNCFTGNPAIPTV